MHKPVSDLLSHIPVSIMKIHHALLHIKEKVLPIGIFENTKSLGVPLRYIGGDWRSGNLYLQEDSLGGSQIVRILIEEQRTPYVSKNSDMDHVKGSLGIIMTTTKLKVHKH